MDAPHNKRGFTLIELLVVIAIIAVLSVVVILTLNPGELLKQSRDSTRLSDMATLKDAISLYLSDIPNPNINLDIRNGTSTMCYISSSIATASCAAWGFSTSVNVSSSVGLTDKRAVNGQGWLPIDFTQLSEGTPFEILPIDPLNNDTYFYAYLHGDKTFKLVAQMESSRYQAGGSGDVESDSIDNGISDNFYEVGTDPSL